MKLFKLFALTIFIINSPLNSILHQEDAIVLMKAGLDAIKIGSDPKLLKFPQYLNGTLLHIAVCTNQSNIVEEVLNLKPNINQTDDYGLTALHYATYIGNLNIVKQLIANGAVINIGNQNSITPLGISIDNNHFEITDFLIQTIEKNNSCEEPYIKKLQDTPLCKHVFKITMEGNVCKITKIT